MSMVGKESTVASEGAADEGPVAAAITGYTQEIQDRFLGELDLVEIIAAQVSRSLDNRVNFDDLLAAGREGLFEAARRFDPKRGVVFRSYANYRVEGAIIDAVRQSMQLPRRAHERLTAMEATSRIALGDVEYALGEGDSDFWSRDLDLYLTDQMAAMVTSSAAAMLARERLEAMTDPSVEANPEKAFERAELLSQIREAMSALDAQEVETIRLCYFDGMSFSEMAEQMNISKAWAHRVHTRAMDRLTKRLKSLSG